MQNSRLTRRSNMRPDNKYNPDTLQYSGANRNTGDGRQCIEVTHDKHTAESGAYNINQRNTPSPATVLVLLVYIVGC